MSLSNFLLTDMSQASIVSTQKAELYMQLYQYAAEDFFTVQDASIYSTLLTAYFTSIEAQLTRCFTQYTSHSHPYSDGVTGPPTMPIAWVELLKPKLKFTAGVEPNLFMNRVTVGLPSEGPFTLGLRRQAPLKLTLVPSIPPLFNTTL